MQHEADDHQPQQGAGVPEREQGIAQRPGEHADQQRPLHAELPQHQRHDQQEQRLGDLAEGLHGRGGLHPDLVEVEVGEVVVERQRDADQDRGEEEDQVGAGLQQREGVQPQHVAHGDAVPRRLRRGVRECEGVDAQQRRADRGHDEGVLERSPGLPAEPADEQPCDDPADGAEHADRRELPLRAGQAAEGDRVRQSQRRHEGDHRQQREHEERPEVALSAGEEEHHGAEQVQHAEDALRGEPAVGDQAHDEGGEDRAEGLGEEGQGDLAAARAEVRGEVRAERDEPGAPHEELQEHHRRESEADDGVECHAWRI